MAHCKEVDLADVSRLLSEIRKVEALKEKSFGCFYLKGKGVLHFHKTKEGRRFAHVWNGKKWEELDIDVKPSLRKQMALLKTLLQKLPF